MPTGSNIPSTATLFPGSVYTIQGAFIGSTAVLFPPTRGLVVAHGVLEMEFSGRGGGWTTVTDWIRSTGITWHRGLPGNGVNDCVADVGNMSFTLDNSEKNSAKTLGYYSPDNPNKRPNFGLNIGVRYRIGGYIRFTGSLDSIHPIPGTHGVRTVSCEAVDWMDVAQRTRINDLPVRVNKRGDEVFQTLVDSLNSVSKPLFIEKDLSPDVYPYTLDRTRDEQTVLRDEFYRLAMSGLSKVWVRGDGTAVYEARTRRAASSAPPTDYFPDSHGFTAVRDRTNVVNRVQSTVHPRLPATSYVVMYTLDTPTAINPGEPVIITGPWTDPTNPDVRVGAVDLLTVTATTDYLANSAADGSGTDLTAFLTVTTGLSGNATQFKLTLGGSTSGYV